MSQRPFVFRDGERVMQLGAGVVDQSTAFLRDCGFDGELGVMRADLDQVLDDVMYHPGIAVTPGGAGREDIRGLLESAHPG